MEPKTIKIDEVEYVRRDCIPVPTGDIKIVVLQRGWVAVGYYSQKAEICFLSNASIIRVWGTTNGLGEIAYSGPTSKTVLDKCPKLIFNEMTMVFAMDCTEEKWAGKLS